MLPPLPSVQLIHERLQSIYPDGISNRNYCVREMAAKTIFVMLYTGAVVNSGRWIRPDQVTRMTDRQAAQATDDQRQAWASLSLKPSKGDVSGRWYQANTREPIRDETLREGLIPTGAVKERDGLPTTSSKPRYALTGAFANLFDPALEGQGLQNAIEAWQESSLTPTALARVAILRRGVVAPQSGVMVTFPNGETRRMKVGPSSDISKAVIEEFAPRFLEKPGVVFLSESGNKVVARDEELAGAIGLKIQADKNLPDLILVDLGPVEPLLVFVEVVATDGPIGETRKAALLGITERGGFPPEHVAFVTAYADRSVSAFKKTVDALAWGTFAWFMSEPDDVFVLYEGVRKGRSLGELMGNVAM